MSGPRVLEVGVIGAGQIGAELHLPVLSCIDGLRVAWLADRDGDRARAVAKSFGVRQVPLGDAAAVPPADVVVLAIPYGARRDYLRSLGAAGIAAYVEKPFARTLAEHDQYAAAFAPERLAVGYKFRAGTSVRTLRDVVREALFGKLMGIDVRFGWPGVSTGGRYSSNLAMAGGGLLFEVGCHYLDLALFIADAEAVHVDSGRMTTDDGFDLHTQARAQVVTPDGHPVELDVLVTNLQHTSMTVGCRFEHAEVTLNVWTDSLLEVRSRRGGLKVNLSARHNDAVRTPFQLLHAQWVDFADALREARECEVSARRTRVTTSLIEQLYALNKAQP